MEFSSTEIGKAVVEQIYERISGVQLQASKSETSVNILGEILNR